MKDQECHKHTEYLVVLVSKLPTGIDTEYKGRPVTEGKDESKGEGKDEGKDEGKGEDKGSPVEVPFCMKCYDKIKVT